METLITILHISACIGLIAIVLLQHGKGADIGAAFGGGASNTVFGGRGAGNFLTKLTTGSVIVFMTTSLVLSYFGGGASVSDELRDASTFEATLEFEPEPPVSQFPEAAPIAPSSDAPQGFEAIPAPGADSASDQ